MSCPDNVNPEYRDLPVSVSGIPDDVTPLPPMKQPLLEIDESGEPAWDMRPVPVAPQSRSIVPAQGTPIAACPSNIDVSTARGKALLLKGSSPGELSIPDGGELRMVATHWLIVPDTQVDEKSGELKEFCRTVLFDVRGQHFRTTAAHGPFRLRSMLELYSPQEWAAGIPLVVSVRKSKRGTTYHDIQIDLEALGDVE